jgi:DHA2 family multidrug resistance protein
MICIALFSASSLLCGLAPTMPVLLLARILQGASGGGMQPMAQAIMADSFPIRKRAAAFALFGITIMVAPALGPIVGGWITDNYSWRWIFLINLPVGLLALALIYKLVDDPPFLRRIKPAEMRFDTFGLALLVLGVGALQILLDKGQEDDWLGSHFIVSLIITAVVCLITLAFWEWRHKHPLIDVHLYTSFNFSAVNFMIFLAGAVVFSSTVLMPQFLQSLAGYSAQQAGLVVSAGAAFLILTMPFVAFLTTRVPVKYLIAFGFLSSAVGLYLSTQLLSLNVSFATACGIMILQYAPISFIFLPAITASFFGLPPEKSDTISGLTNFSRNIGSSFGASIVTTVLARRSQFHIARLSEHLGPSSPILAKAVQIISAHLRVPNRLALSVGVIYQQLIIQAATLSFIDTYVVLGLASFTMFFASFFLQSNDPTNTQMPTAH